jgi:spermidine/putrescine transport system permease protein
MRKALGAYTALLLAALYAPIAVMVLFSFNASKYSVKWTGFTLDWYRKMFDNREVRDCLWTTLGIALAATALAAVLGTMAALAARRAFPGKRLYATLVSLPVMVPDIVLAIALLALFDAVKAPLSPATAVAANATFNLAYVAVVVSARLQGMDRSVELAAQDLGATPFQAFRRVTLPAILPGVLSGAVLAFTLSFDDFVITYFTIGAGNATLPTRIYSMVKFGVSPEINALSTVILAASLALIVAALRISRVPVAGGGR